MNYDPNIPAIPTVYKGTEMRSRLEAKWAAFFDAVGLPWEYEPIKLGVWCPDFRLVVPCTAEKCGMHDHTVLAEVKPFHDIDMFAGHASERFKWGKGIDEEGIAHLGSDWQTTKIYMTHATFTRVPCDLKNRLKDICDEYDNQGGKDIFKYCKKKWSEAESAIGDIRQQEKLEAAQQAAPILQMHQSKSQQTTPEPTSVDPAVFVIGGLLSCIQSQATYTTEDVLDVVRSSVLTFDKQARANLTTDDRLRLLDTLHMIEAKSNAIREGRKAAR